MSPCLVTLTQLAKCVVELLLTVNGEDSSVQDMQPQAHLRDLHTCQCRTIDLLVREAELQMCHKMVLCGSRMLG